MSQGKRNKKVKSFKQFSKKEKEEVLTYLQDLITEYNLFLIPSKKKSHQHFQMLKLMLSAFKEAWK